MKSSKVCSFYLLNTDFFQKKRQYLLIFSFKKQEFYQKENRLPGITKKHFIIPMRDMNYKY